MNTLNPQSKKDHAVYPITHSRSGIKVWAVTQLCGFGDLFIARWAFRQLEDPDGLDLRFILADHLAALDSAMGLDGRVHFLNNRDLAIPDLFDVRRRGLFNALLSGFKLRQQMHQVIHEQNIPSETQLVFPFCGLRQRFISGTQPAFGLPETAKNIYLAYLAMFDLEGLGWSLHAAARPGPFLRIGIFPGSRRSMKRIPASVVEAVRLSCKALGLDTQVFMLENESQTFELQRGITTVPRDPRVMMDTIQGLDAVISADSMAAHSAEFFGIPVFVFTRQPNPYWLPLSAYRAGWTALFNDDLKAQPTLHQFLQGGQDQKIADLS